MKEKDVRFKCSNCGYTKVITKQILNIDGSYQIECACRVERTLNKGEVNSILYNYCEEVSPTKDGNGIELSVAHMPYTKLNLTYGLIESIYINLFDEDMFYSTQLDFYNGNLGHINQLTTTKMSVNKIKITNSILPISNTIENIQAIYDHMITFIKNMHKARLYL